MIDNIAKTILESIQEEEFKNKVKFYIVDSIKERLNKKPEKIIDFINSNKFREVIINTLNIYSSFDDKKILNENNSILLSSIANCLAKSIENYKDEIFNYLDETLIKVNDFKDDYDYKEKLVGEYVGVFLLTLGRSKLLDKKYYKLVRPYHRYIQYSVFPSKLFFELLSYTSLEHQELIKKQFNIKNI